MSKVITCPKCGIRPSYYGTKRYGLPYTGKYYCYGCNIDTGFKPSEEDAASAWNNGIYETDETETNMLRADNARLTAELAQEREKHGWIPYILHVQPVDKMPSHGRGFYPIMSYGKPSFQYWDEEGKRFDGDIRVDCFMDIILPYIPQSTEDDND